MWISVRKGERKRSRSTSETRRHANGYGKGDTKGKGTCPSGKSKKLVCYHFQMATRIPHAITDSSNHKSQHGCLWRDTSVFRHTGKAREDENGSATSAIRLEETKGLNGVIDRRPRRYVLSTTCLKENLIATNILATIQSAIFSQSERPDL